eukprot:11465040-Prorocentrum_lima.AAC.1
MALHKTQVWLTGIETLPPGPLSDVWAKQSRFDGVVICGEPLDSSLAATEDRSCPVGEAAFVQDYLLARYRQQEQ